MKKLAAYSNCDLPHSIYEQADFRRCLASISGCLCTSCCSSDPWFCSWMCLLQKAQKVTSYGLACKLIVRFASSLSIFVSLLILVLSLCKPCANLRTPPQLIYLFCLLLHYLDNVAWPCRMIHLMHEGSFLSFLKIYD